MQKIFTILHRAFYVAIIAVIALLLFALFPIKGNYQIKIVQSGSMEPTLHTGSVVVIKPQDTYTMEDVVTFGKDTKKDVPTTHRIVSSRAQTGVILFTTKGDANKTPDVVEIRQSEIHGKVLFSIPFIGYMIDFARKPIGFALLVIVPAVIVVLDEGWKIFKEFRRLRAEKKAEDNKGKKEDELTTP